MPKRPAPLIDYDLGHTWAGTGYYAQHLEYLFSSNELAVI